jgi:hypothetical protein
VIHRGNPASALKVNERARTIPLPQEKNQSEDQKSARQKMAHRTPSGGRDFAVGIIRLIAERSMMVAKFVVSAKNQLDH